MSERVAELCRARRVARRMVNERPDQLTPYEFIDRVEQFAGEHKLKATIFRDGELQRQGLNLIYSVGKGSEHRPGLAIVEYRGAQGDEFIGLVGKGVTYDTGGLNVKPTGFMEDMFIDKGGACVVFAVF